MLDHIVGLRDRELFTLCAGFFGIATALVTEAAGFSLAIGAFLAGLIISESEYGLQALSDVLPFRALFSGVFFTSIGMLLDLFVRPEPAARACCGHARVDPGQEYRGSGRRAGARQRARDQPDDRAEPGPGW